MSDKSTTKTTELQDTKKETDKSAKFYSQNNMQPLRAAADRMDKGKFIIHNIKQLRDSATCTESRSYFYLIKSIINSSNCINILGDYLYSDTNYGFFQWVDLGT